MRAPIPVEKAEELIFHYVCLRYRMLRGEAIKLRAAIKEKAQQLGFGVTAAWNLIRYARDVGMVEGERYFGIY